MGRNGIVIIFILIIQGNAWAQSSSAPAYHYKLDYDVPESPAFSIVDANPATVMRGSAAKEFALNIANNFVSNNKQESGIAADFNPFFVFGGRLKSINEYRGKENYLTRLAANTQLSFASTRTEAFANDNILSGGIKITLFDDFDLLKDEDLGRDIDRALIPEENPVQPVFGNEPDSIDSELVEIPSLIQAYENAKERIKDNNGGAVSIGAAIAQRSLNGNLSRDSIINYRNQIWLTGQYNFWKRTKCSWTGHGQKHDASQHG